jgi:putative DNA primase/helicase
MDFKGLALHLLQSATSILSEWLPGGRVIGHEYCCGDISGGPGDSFKVNIKTGVFAEFAGDLTGADLISLYSTIHNIKPHQAYNDLCQQYNYHPILTADEKFRHFKHGLPTAVWHYQEESGKTIMHVARYETKSGKQFCPFSYNNGELQYKSLPDSRPLYNLPDIIRHPDRPVIIVEGEKACVALQSIVKHRYVVTTWSGGCRAHDKTNFKPLQGRKIILWPDADDPGRTAMHHIEIKLSKIAQSVKTLTTNDLPDGHDAADFEGEWPVLCEFIKERISQVTLLPPQAKIIDPDAPVITGSAVDAWKQLEIKLNNSGNAIANVSNANQILAGCGKYATHIWYDEFLDRVMCDFDGPARPWTDTDDINIAIDIQKHLEITGMTDVMIFKACQSYARKHTKNVIKDYLNALKWDNKQRITTFFHDICGSEQNDYSTAVSRNFILSMVARVYNPGCKADCMPILECGQGVKKSTMLSVLAGPAYFANASSNVHHVDFFQCLKGKWLVEFAELHQFSRADITKLKDIMSTPVDTYRASYGRSPGDYPRKSIFAGTTNETTYLSDNTGARRFWPIEVKHIDISLLRDTRNQLFAEAVHIYKSEQVIHDEQRTHSNWWIMPKSTFDEQESRRVRDPWEDDIWDFVNNKHSVTIQQILNECLKMDVSKKARSDEMRVAGILKFMGFKRSQVRNGNLKQWVYTKPYEPEYIEQSDFEFQE